MRAKIDINEVEVRTKIRAKYLRAIENEEWDLLPGDVYVRSFLRTYGDFLGLDSRGLIDEYKRRYERPSDHDVRPITPRSDRDRSRRRRSGGPLLPPWLLVGTVLVAIVVVLYFVGRSGTSSPSSTVTHRSVPRHPAPGSAHAAPRRVRRRATVVRLQLVPTGAVYVCLVDGKGRRLISGQIYNVGQTIPTEKSSELLLTLGNASVKMKVNGAPVAVAPSTSSIGYRLTPTSHTLLPTAQQPSCA
jgi:cytoskeleton protein RodZ